MKGACTASALVIKHKVFYDFKFTFSFKAIEIGNWIGVHFRRQSLFTFYALDITNEQIRLRFMNMGK